MVFLASDFYQKQPIWFQKTQQGCFKPSQTKHFSSPWSTRFCEQLDIIELWIFRMSSLLYNKHYVALIILYQYCLLMFFAMIWPLGQRGWIIVVLHKKIEQKIFNMHCVSSICNAYPQCDDMQCVYYAYYILQLARPQAHTFKESIWDVLWVVTFLSGNFPILKISSATIYVNTKNNLCMKVENFCKQEQQQYRRLLITSSFVIVMHMLDMIYLCYIWCLCCIWCLWCLCCPAYSMCYAFAHSICCICAYMYLTYKT